MNAPIDISTFGWVIADIARLLRKLADHRLSDTGVTRAQWRAIANLQRLGPMTQAALADVMEMETATIARLIDRLEAAEWVGRLPDPSDRRAKLVSITPKAQTVMDEVSAIGQRLLEDVMGDLSPAERDQLITMLSTVKSRLFQLLESRGS